jgi:hypothetical protein
LLISRLFLDFKNDNRISVKITQRHYLGFMAFH